MSGRKLILSSEGYQLPDDAGNLDISMGASFNSKAMKIELFDDMGIQMNCVGTPSGTFAVSVSNDHKELNGTVVRVGNFIPLSLPQVPTVSGSTAYLGVNVQLLGFLWFRVEYTRTGGTGTCNLWLAAKMI